MSSYEKLSDLKRGDKFYWYDGTIFILHEVKVPCANQIDFVVRKNRTRGFIKMSHSGKDATNLMVFRYKGRDKASFNAGFKFAIQYCSQYMDDKQKALAQVDSDVMMHLKLNSIYNYWINSNNLNF